MTLLALHKTRPVSWASSSDEVDEDEDVELD